MANTFEYDAPQFLDFNEGLDDSDGADKFFDVQSDTPCRQDPLDKRNNCNNGSTVEIKKEDVSCDECSNICIPDPNIIVKSEPQSPNHDENTEGTLLRDVKEKLVLDRKILKPVRRVSGIKKELSIATVEPFVEVEQAVSMDYIETRKRPHEVKEEKMHSMTTRLDKKIKTPIRDLRNRTVVLTDDKENRKRKAGCDTSNLPEKYVAMAEQVLHFQRDTPPRFRQHRRRSSVSMQVNLLKSRNSYNPRRTIALTPKLMTSQRSRPVEVLTQVQKEELELNEIKKNQVKAHPLNEKVLQPPKLPEKVIKETTVAEPFNLTKVFKKPQDHKDVPYKFTAKPLPKAIFKKAVGLPEKTELPITVPQSPAITKSVRYQARPMKMDAFSVRNEQGAVSSSSLGVPFKKPHDKTTEVKPFSFDVRNQEMIEKKEKKILEILEAEKKMREFKANPLPVFNAPKEINRSSKHSHHDCSKSSVSSTSEIPHLKEPFKARSPTVLRKPKFQVTLVHAHSEAENIELHTERRVKERSGFEERQQEKQEMIAIAKEQMEQRKKRQEADEIARIRSEAVHKAQPMPKFKPISNKINSRMPLTEPRSPCFTKRTRGDKLCSINQDL